MKVVLSADVSDESRSALRWCVDHLGYGDEVIAVAGVNQLGEFVLGVPPFDSISSESELLRQVKQDYCGPLEDRGVTARAQLTAHSQARAVADIATSEGADLIVVGKSPHGVFGDAVRSEVASHLVHHPPCALVVVPTHVPASRP